ncbi:MAG: hypothetical protein WCC59_15135 [Terriglobales bacterium]
MGAEIDTWTAARMLCVSDQTVRLYVGKGILSASRNAGGHFHVSRQSVLDLLARMRAQANAPRDPQKT